MVVVVVIVVVLVVVIAAGVCGVLFVDVSTAGGSAPGLIEMSAWEVSVYCQHTQCMLCSSSVGVVVRVLLLRRCVASACQ